MSGEPVLTLPRQAARFGEAPGHQSHNRRDDPDPCGRAPRRRSPIDPHVAPSGIARCSVEGAVGARTLEVSESPFAPIRIAQASRAACGSGALMVGRFDRMSRRGAAEEEFLLTGNVPPRHSRAARVVLSPRSLWADSRLVETLEPSPRRSYRTSFQVTAPISAADSRVRGLDSSGRLATFATGALIPA
jgi:hypothetical protein